MCDIYSLTVVVRLQLLHMCITGMPATNDAAHACQHWQRTASGARSFLEKLRAVMALSRLLGTLSFGQTLLPEHLVYAQLS